MLEVHKHSSSSTYYEYDILLGAVRPTKDPCSWCFLGGAAGERLSAADYNHLPYERHAGKAG